MIPISWQEYNNVINQLAPLLSQSVYNTTVIVDASSNPLFASDKLLVCNIRSVIKMLFEIQSTPNSLRWIRLIVSQFGNYMRYN